MNQVLKFVIQFVYYHQKDFSNKYFLVFIKLHSMGFLTLNLFKKAGYREKRYRKKYKRVSFTFDIVLKGFLRKNYTVKIFEFLNNKGLLVQI